MTRRLYIAALLAGALLLPSVGAFAQPRAGASRRPAVSSREAGPLIKPADIFDAMYFRERADSRITPDALAAYGNSLVARRGLDFGVDACAVMEANMNAPRAPSVSESARVFAYTMRRVGGGQVRLRLITDVFDTQPDRNCGECYFAVPALRVTRSEMLVVAEGRRYRLERPDAFLLSEASLMDDSLKTARRSWQLPYQAEALGLSADRTRLYITLPEFDDVQWDDQLALELSDAGVRFVARERLRLPKGESLASPAETAEADETFVRFGACEQAYVIRISAPCA